MGAEGCRNCIEFMNRATTIGEGGSIRRGGGNDRANGNQAIMDIGYIRRRCCNGCRGISNNMRGRIGQVITKD